MICCGNYGNPPALPDENIDWEVYMDWKVILGRIAGAIPPLAVLVFGVIGYTPTWWEGVIAVFMPVIMWLISKIPDKA